MRPSVCWLAYAAAFAAHLLLQAAASVRSSSNSLKGLAGVRQYFALTWHLAAGRAIFTTVFFGIWLGDPKLLAIFSFVLPVTPWTCALFGLGGDALLDKLLTIFGLRVDISSVAPRV